MTYRHDDDRRLPHQAVTPALLVALLLSAAQGASAAHHESKDGDEAAAAVEQSAAPVPAKDESSGRYTFSWMFGDDDALKPRGGTTKGPAIELVAGPTEDFMAVTQGGLEGRERDRQAILSLAGAYRTSFDFLETMGFTPDYEPPRPYQSWGTEHVYVVADEPDFISLQHILVMRIKLEDGSLSEPYVIKHWRHDWRYQDRDIHEYAGFNSWEHRRLTRREARGAWSHAVYQVDDSPRYETVGRWTHEPGYSHWESERMYRPLPRREFSVRDDYHALDGTVRFTLTPTGWIMEEDALKLVLDEDGQPRMPLPYVARETGISRYERIQNYDFSAGDEYWEATGPFWAGVREYWREMYKANDRIALLKSADNKPLFVTLFELADQYQKGDLADADVLSTVDSALAPYWR